MNKRKRKKLEKKKITIDKLVKCMHKMNYNFSHIGIDNIPKILKELKSDQNDNRIRMEIKDPFSKGVFYKRFD